MDTPTATNLTNGSKPIPDIALKSDGGFLDPYIFDPEASAPAEERLYAGWISKGDLCVWIGREKHRKTNVVLQCAICMALGRDFLNLRFAAARPLKLVIVDYESKHGMLKQRYDAICAAMKLTEEEHGLLKKKPTNREGERVLAGW